MQTKKLSVIIIIVVVLAAGWYLSVKKVSGVDDINAQNELVAKADKYFDKELYVRAIPLYKEALAYSTDENINIQEKLLATYKNYGDTSSYIKLAQQRISDKIAKEQEYLDVAEYYLQRSNVEESMNVIKAGMEELSLDVLEQFYVENRFANYSIKTTGYEKIMPSASNSVMPAFDGEKWVYIDEDGRDIQIGEFDSVLPFNTDGYAVVSINGKYRTICSNGDLYGIDETGVEEVYYMTGSGVIAKCNGKYSYYNYDFEKTSTLEYDEITTIRSGVIAVKDGDRWGILDSSGKMVGDFSYLDIAVNSLGSVFYGGHGMVKNSNGWQLIDTDGNEMANAVFYDAKAPESEKGYIAVANAKGKWGFIDLDGNLVIDYKYDDAKSYSNGLAAVCIGERWQYIDDRDNVVIDVNMEDAEPFHKGIAQVGMVDGTAILKLRYYEE
jgi:tetratricopeptide (TPR) repeat protein